MKLYGWMRLWVVLSACWLMLTGFLAYNALSSLYTKKTYEVAKDEIGRAEFVFSAAQSDAEINELLVSEFIPLFENVPKDYVNKVVSTPYEKYVEKHASVEIWKYVKIMLLPVIGLLALGCSFVWVRLGFRGNTNA